MNLTAGLRRSLQRDVPLDDLLPDELPAYVHSYVYLFGIATVASLVVLILSGIWLAAAGPTWWHVSALDRFLNGVHFWGTQAFFFLMVLHLWTAFFQGAWRDGRGATWAVGVLCFLVGIGTAFTGYLSQQNFDAQWIAVQSKDAMNAIGIGAFFNVLNFGQMYGFHIVILPAILTDNTRSLLFLQASALPALAARYHLVGSQWGMMNETGNYPGQAWLWLYTFWYQVPAYANSPNADALVWATMAVLCLALLLLPWLPGLNRLPRLLGIYRLIWRDYYRDRTALSVPAPDHAQGVPPGGRR